MPTLISVVIPVYKRPELLKQAVASVIAQTHRPIELVIVDDGSPDDTAKQMQSLIPEVEAAGIQASFHTKQNGGVASARNFGIARATGEFIALLDADDEFFPTKLEKQLAALRAAGADAACCQVERRFGEKTRIYPGDPSGLIQGIDPAGTLAMKAWAHTNSLFLSRALIDRAGVYDESLAIYEDDEYLIRLAHHGSFAWVPEVLATWIDQPESLSQVPDLETQFRRDDSRRLHLQLIRQKCESLPGWNEAAWKENVARCYRQMVNHRIWANDLKGATRTLKEAVKLAGRQPFLKRPRMKLLKAKLLRLFGMRVRDSKHNPIYDQATRLL